MRPRCAAADTHDTHTHTPCSSAVATYWLTPVHVCVAAIAAGQSTDPSCTLLPSTRYRLAVAAANSAGWGPLSKVLTVETDAVQHCGNPSDLAAFKRTKQTMQKTIQSCLIGCALKPNKKVCAAKWCEPLTTMPVPFSCSLVSWLTAAGRMTA